MFDSKKWGTGFESSEGLCERRDVELRNAEGESALEGLEQRRVRPPARHPPTHSLLPCNCQGTHLHLLRDHLRLYLLRWNWNSAEKRNWCRTTRLQREELLRDSGCSCGSGFHLRRCGHFWRQVQFEHETGLEFLLQFLNCSFQLKIEMSITQLERSNQ